MLTLLSNVYLNTNRPTLAETTTSESITLCKPLSNTDPDYLACSGILVDASTNMSLAYIYSGRIKEAEKVLSDALPTARDLASRSFPLARLGLFQILNNLVLVYVAEDQYKEAETTANEALTVTSAFTETQLRDASSSAIKINLGMIYTVTKRFDQAEKIYKEALATRKELASHAPGAFLPDVAKILVGLSDVYNNTQRVDDASKALGEAIDIYRQEIVHAPVLGGDLILSLIKMAELESQGGRFEDAEKALQEAKNTITTVPNLDVNSRTALSQLLNERLRKVQKALNGEP
jgi:tetratricopeptide (TPR) repeat protein